MRLQETWIGAQVDVGLVQFFNTGSSAGSTDPRKILPPKRCLRVCFENRSSLIAAQRTTLCVVTVSDLQTRQYRHYCPARLQSTFQVLTAGCSHDLYAVAFLTHRAHFQTCTTVQMRVHVHVISACKKSRALYAAVYGGTSVGGFMGDMQGEHGAGQVPCQYRTTCSCQTRRRS